MIQSYEICIACGNHTGKAGAGEDSIYVGDNCGLGPLCEECYDDVLESVTRDFKDQRVGELEAEVERLGVLVVEAYREALIECGRGQHADSLWRSSDAKKALEVTT